MASWSSDLAQFSAPELRKLSFQISEELVDREVTRLSEAVERELQDLCAELHSLETLVGVQAPIVGVYEIARPTPRQPAYRFDSADDNWGCF